MGLKIGCPTWKYLRNHPDFAKMLKLKISDDERG
jgi:hypothetical protein